MEISHTDLFLWRRKSNGIFYVHSCVEALNENRMEIIPIALLNPIKSMWNIKVPPGLLIFGWRLLVNRILTKDQLFKRGIMSEYGDL